jgi:arsenate reductase (thioredoxin)
VVVAAVAAATDALTFSPAPGSGRLGAGNAVIGSLRREDKVAPVESNRQFNVLFLCTGNSARSIMAEVLLNHLGKGRFHAFSAGSHPRGSVHPLGLETLRRNHLPVDGLRSKSWDEFAEGNAPPLDFVFTVCDRAAQEVCPLWPGQPMTAHWGIEDPALAEGSEEQQQRAFNLAFRALDARLRLFTSLPIQSLDSLALQRQLDSIGRIGTGD